MLMAYNCNVVHVQLAHASHYTHMLMYTASVTFGTSDGLQLRRRGGDCWAAELAHGAACISPSTCRP